MIHAQPALPLLLHLMTKKFVSALAFAMLAFGNVHAAPVSYSHSGTISIPDNSPSGVSSVIAVNDAGIVNSLTVTVAIDHTYTGDLRIRLAHGGTEVLLLNRPGTPMNTSGSGDDYASAYPLTFSDTGQYDPDTIFGLCGGSRVGGVCPWTDLIPKEPLAAFTGMSLLGDWTITISDHAGYDFGRLTSWSINVGVADAPVGIPEPGSAALLALGLAGLAAVGRRKRL